jgi:hypothetical protein
MTCLAILALLLIFVAAETCLPRGCVSPKGGRHLTEPFPCNDRRGAHTGKQTDGRDLWRTLLRWAQVPWYTKFHEDWFRHSKVDGWRHRQDVDRMSLLQEGRPSRSILEDRNSTSDYHHTSSTYCNVLIKGTIKTDTSMVKIKGCSQRTFGNRHLSLKIMIIPYPVQDWCKCNYRAQFIAEVFSDLPLPFPSY